MALMPPSIQGLNTKPSNWQRQKGPGGQPTVPAYTTGMGMPASTPIENINPPGGPPPTGGPTTGGPAYFAGGPGQNPQAYPTAGGPNFSLGSPRPGGNPSPVYDLINASSQPKETPTSFATWLTGPLAKGASSQEVARRREEAGLGGGGGDRVGGTVPPDPWAAIDAQNRAAAAQGRTDAQQAQAKSDRDYQAAKDRQAAEDARLREEAFRRQQYNSAQQTQQQLLSSIQGLQPGGGGEPPTTATGPVTPAPERIGTPGREQIGDRPLDDSAIRGAATEAQRGAFAQGKAQAGALGRASVEALRSNLAERGMVGSGIESRGLVDRLAAATNPLSDINVAQQRENVGIAQKTQELGEKRAMGEYQGSITQRAQDIGVGEGNLERQLSARGQDLNKYGMDLSSSQARTASAAAARRDQLASLQSILSGLGRNIY